jgi:hypothetical protein
VRPEDEGTEEVSYHKAFAGPQSIPGLYQDDDVAWYKDPAWYTSGSSWLMVGRGIEKPSLAEEYRGMKETQY